MAYAQGGREGPPSMIGRDARDLRGWLVGLPGLEPGTSSLSGFCTRACFPRIPSATCANDVPLETVGNRSGPMACGPNLAVWASRSRPVADACGAPVLRRP